MSKELFKEAIVAAREIQEITRSKEETEGVTRLSADAMDRVQQLVEAAQAAMTKAAVEGDFGSVQEARLALRGLPANDYDALRAFAERNMPVNPTTQFLAEAIAPGRSATLAAFKKSPFGSGFESKPAAKAGSKAEAISREAIEPESEELQGSLKLSESDEKKASRAEAARAAEEKTLREQNQSFQSLTRAFGKALPASKAGKASIAAVPGVKVVEGEKQAAEPVAELPAEARARKEAALARAAKAGSGKKLSAREEFERAQLGLFDAGSAPVPADAEQRRGRGRPRKNKAM